VPLRSELITKLPLTKGHERVSRAVLDDREAGHLRNLMVDVPVLRHLRASTVHTEYLPADQALWLIVSLVESAQPALALHAEEAAKAAQEADPYLDDLADARRQLQAVPWRVQLALSGAASPLDGTFDGPDASSTASIRQRVRRGMKGESLLLPGWQDAQIIPIGGIPSTLTQGPIVDLLAQVEWIESAGAQLGAFEAIAAASADLKFKASRGLYLSRPGAFSRAEYGTRLQVAMDRGEPLRLRAVSALDWATGVVVSFELRGFIDQ